MKFKKNDIINFYGWKARIGAIVKPKYTNFNGYLYLVGLINKTERSGVNVAVGWENLIPYLNFIDKDIKAGLVKKYEGENIPELCSHMIVASTINICNDISNINKTKIGVIIPLPIKTIDY